jgi:hypothetical protein
VSYLLSVLLLAGAAFSQSGFSGTWKTNFEKSKMPTNAETRVYENGTYQCSDCNIKEVKADGQDQKVSNPYVDTFSVKAADDHTIEKVGKKNGKVVAKVTETVSPDGNTMTTKWWSLADNGQEQTGTFVATRVGTAPQGKHAVNGEWKPEKAEANDTATTFTLKQAGDSFSMSSPNGSAFDAKLDGKEYPYKGDPGISTVVLRRVDDKTIEETDLLNGKPVFRAKYQLAADGKTMNVDFEDLRDSRTRNPKFEAVMDRQSSTEAASKK